MEADKAQISRRPFEEFVAALLEWRTRTNHARMSPAQALWSM
jgi:hypothetical protein